jgi:heme-degrading monooxygenase HmoA
MTIRRTDFAEIKPGRRQDYIAAFHDFCSHLHRHGIDKVILNRESIAGIGQPLVYAFTDWESMEAYGEFMDAGLRDEALQASYQQFFSADAPCTFMGSALLTELVTYGQPPGGHPGTAASVRRWREAPGATETNLKAWEQLSSHVQKLGGFSGMWRLLISGEMTGDLVTGVAFPDSASLGKWMTLAATDPEIIKITAPYASRSPDAPAQQVHASIDIVLASSSA